MERTFSIIKPDAVKRNLMGHINQLIEKNNLKILASKTHKLSKKEAEAFYGVHKERPFFNSLVEFMTSGPVQVQVLEGENAVASYREIMGATNPEDADEGTIRKLFAESIEANSVHGSDSSENASIEIAFFFSGLELI
jgi:nucleoside-diphosphate kinase|tara:strand:- start:1509 stop:1922 length:414 start_codon:yes stop_codon:yes gene_type:complete